MRLGLTIFALMALTLTGCGGGLITGATGAPVTTSVTPNVDADLSRLELSDVAGVYDIQNLSFDADSEPTCDALVTITTQLPTIPYTVNCVNKAVDAFIDDGFLIITTSGTFTFLYSFSGDKNTLLSVGSFDAGSMSGTVLLKTIDGKDYIGFVSSDTDGLLAYDTKNESKTLYSISIQDGVISLVNPNKDVADHFFTVTAKKE